MLAGAMRRRRMMETRMKMYSFVVFPIISSWRGEDVSHLLPSLVVPQLVGRPAVTELVQTSASSNKHWQIPGPNDFFRPLTSSAMGKKKNKQVWIQSSSYITGLRLYPFIQIIRPWCWYCEREFEDEKGEIEISRTSAEGLTSSS